MQFQARRSQTRRGQASTRNLGPTYTSRHFMSHPKPSRKVDALTWSSITPYKTPLLKHDIFYAEKCLHYLLSTRCNLGFSVSTSRASSPTYMKCRPRILLTTTFRVCGPASPTDVRDAVDKQGCRTCVLQPPRCR